MNQATNQSGQAGEQSVRPGLKPGERFIKIPDVMSMTGMKATSIYRMQSESKFPHSVPLPGGRSAWLESEVLQWMQERVDLRDAAINPNQRPTP